MSPAAIVVQGISRSKRNPVIQKFAPKLEMENNSSDEKSTTSEEKILNQPVNLRRTQSTKVLDLAASLFRPGEEISTENEPKTRRNTPARSQTMKLTSPKSVSRRQSQDSFIKELLEMAKTENPDQKGQTEPKKINDFKSQISMASTKIIRRKTMTSADDLDKAKGKLQKKLENYYKRLF